MTLILSLYYFTAIRYNGAYNTEGRNLINNYFHLHAWFGGQVVCLPLLEII